MKKTRCSYCGVVCDARIMRPGNLCHACIMGIMEEV